MPSEQQPAHSGCRERYSNLQEDIGEDPARWLDRDLFDHGISYLDDRDEPDFEKGDQRLVREGRVSAPGEMIRDRIAGIDTITIARAWRAVERGLDRTPEGGRDVVIGFIEDRIDELEANGERDLPGRSGEELRELGVEGYEAVAPKPDVVIRGADGEPTGRSEGTTASQKLAAMDRGESR